MSTFEKDYPIHWNIWHGNATELVSDDFAELERRDPRGRTPLMLAVTLGRVECVKVLLAKNADANADNKGYWSVAHEAVATGDPELLQLVLQHREYQRNQKTKRATSNLLKKLQDTPDFYAEMRWEFTSWLPFVSKICPSDTYKVYKSGSCVRVDTTLIGFDASNQWQRGNQTLVFKSVQDGRFLEVAVVDHQLRTVHVERMGTENPLLDSRNATALQPTEPVFERDLESEPVETRMSVDDFRISAGEVAARLTSPIVTTYVDVEKIAFERAKAGFLWRSEKEELVNGYPCKLFGATQVELVTKTRTEHLTERDKRVQDSRNATPIDSLLKFVQGSEVKHEDAAQGDPISLNPNGITAEEYFNGFVELAPDRDIGRPKQVGRRAQSFKAHLWLCEDFPLSLQEQITPIIDLMAANNAHFSRLKNFIELQLPAGFPVKIEIPLFHVINAKITFGNIFAISTPVPLVSHQVSSVTREEEDLVDSDVDKPVITCTIEPEVFDIPEGYRRLDEETEAASAAARPTAANRLRQMQQQHHVWTGQAEDDVMLQWAIQQSMADEHNRDLSLDGIAVEDNISVNEDGDLVDRNVELQQAISESLHMLEVPGALEPPGDDDDLMDLQKILELSKKEEEDRQKRIAEAEEEQIRRALELSMLEQ